MRNAYWNHKCRRRSRRRVTIFVLVAGLSIINLARLLSDTTLDRNDADRPQPAIPIRASSTSASSSSICPHISKLFPHVNHSILEEYLERSRNFHLYGGNLKSIQHYLDRYIQKTYQRLDFSFVPNDPNVVDTPIHTTMTTMTPIQQKPISNGVEYLQSYYNQHNITQGGYNQPLPGYFVGRNWKFLASEKQLGGKSPGRRAIASIMEPLKEERFQVAMGPMGPNCTLHVLEEKYLCQGWSDMGSTDKNSREEDECHIMSIGSNDQWGFERQVVRHAPHCITHTFDCTMIPKRKPNQRTVRFYKTCLGAKPMPGYATYEQLWKETGVQTRQAPRILKMDIEGFEYDVVLHLLTHSSSELWPEQISMEVHWASRMVDLSWMLRTRQAAEISMFFSVLFNVGGYIPVFREFFPVGCPSCMEVLLVRFVCA